MFDVIIDFPKMKVGVVTRDEHVVEIRYLPPSVAAKPARSPLAATAADQLERYRGNPDTRFDFPVLVEGSSLQRAVWDAMCAIPRGSTRTYGDIARDLGADARVGGRSVP
jgi:methylated-DNA-[protein]-cysteine S-methyltransferase